MLSLRALSRVAPKTSFRPSALRSISSLSRNNQRVLLRPSWQAVKKPSYPAFSTSTARREPAGPSDQVLSEKFSLERQLELESRDSTKVPQTIEDFVENGPWTFEDAEGTHEVVLTREFGNENIKIKFSINDMGGDDYAGMEDDTALTDEADFESPKRTINQSGTRGGEVDVMPEDSIAPADREEGESEMSLDFDLTITIMKPGSRAIGIRATAQDGAIAVDSISYFPQAKLIEAKTPEDVQAASRLYVGPPFGNLDPDLQAMFETYLEERGVNSELATFLPEYLDYKEQREYVDWLKNMKDFVEE